MPMAPAMERGLSTHGPRHAVQERRDLRVIQHVHEIGNVEAGLGGPHPHGKLVAEVVRGGLAHARDAQMLAQHCGHLHVEIVQRHDAVQHAGARQVADRVEGLRAVPMVMVVGHVKDLVDAVDRPVRAVLQALRCHQQDGGALAFGFAQKVVALFVAGQAEDGHARNPAEPPTHSSPLLWSTPICAPRPMRTMVLTASSSSR